jgi:hypothetical protein
VRPNSVKSDIPPLMIVVSNYKLRIHKSSIDLTVRVRVELVEREMWT